jgi:hypothetical protein
MNDQLLNVIFFDGEKEYQLNEINEKLYFQQCYKTALVLFKPVIVDINNSESFVYIDTSKDKTEIIKIKNISDELLIKLKEYKIEY